MKSKLNFRSLMFALVTAFLLLTVAPSVMTQSHLVHAKSVSLKLSKTKAKVKVKKSKTITAKCKKKVKWSLSDKKVASIKAKGNKVTVTGKKNGVTALIAKVGKKKVVCQITVGKGASYSSISSKTKKALKLSAAQALAKYLNARKGKAITLYSDNLSTSTEHYGGGNSWTSNRNIVYKLSSTGGNIVLQKTETTTTHNAKYYNQTSKKYEDCNIDDTDVEVTTLSIPVDGTKTATYKYSYSSHDYNFTDGKYEDDTYSSETTFDISSFQVGTALNWTRTDTDEDPYTREVYAKDSEGNTQYDGNGDPIVAAKYESHYTLVETSNGFARTSSGVANMLNLLDAILVDNNTGFRLKDLGFKFSTSRYGIGVMTNSELSRIAAQLAAERAFNESAAYLNRTVASSTTTTYTDGERNGQVETSNSSRTYSNGELASNTWARSSYYHDGEKYVQNNSSSYSEYDTNDNVIKYVSSYNGTDTEKGTYTVVQTTNYSYDANNLLVRKEYTSVRTYDATKETVTYSDTYTYAYDSLKRKIEEMYSDNEGYWRKSTRTYYELSGKTYYDEKVTTSSGSNWTYEQVLYSSDDD